MQVEGRNQSWRFGSVVKVLSPAGTVTYERRDYYCVLSGERRSEPPSPRCEVCPVFRT
jgi:hypothetical protein